MGEVPLAFDIPLLLVDVKGTNNIPINTTGNERTSFTIVLRCAADGTKLPPPMLIFKKKKKKDPSKKTKSERSLNLCE